MSHDELLQMLQDIDGPVQPAWWLPGPGHYLVLILLALGLAGAWVYRRRRRSRYWRRIAAAELERITRRYHQQGDSLASAHELSAWLRRVSLLAFPDQAPAGLVGDAWLRFLDRQHAAGGFEHGIGRVFGDRIYRRDLAPDVVALSALCESWLASVAPGLRRRDLP